MTARLIGSSTATRRGRVRRYRHAMPAPRIFLDSDTLIPGPNPLLGALSFDAWFARSQAMQ